MDFGKGLGFWNTMPTRRRNSATLTERSYISLSSSSTLPSIRQMSTRSFMRLKQRSSVDLPHPEGPMNAVTRFLGMVTLTLMSAWAAP